MLLSDKNSRCTQTKIGNHLGVTFQQVQKYENNTNDINLWNFIKLCEYFKEKPSDVINTCNADGYFNVKASVPMTNEEEYKNAGITEDQAKKEGYKIKVGKFPFSALGKALAEGERNGFVKIIYDNKYGELLGCHIIGKNATNLISEIAVARNLETTYYEVLKTIHPHPTLSEAIHEATGDALNEAIHI